MAIETGYVHPFFINNTFISNVGPKLAKNQANTKQHPEAELCYLKIIHILHLSYNPEVQGNIQKNKWKNKSVCSQEIVRLIIMKMEIKMKNRSQRYDINRPTIIFIIFWCFAKFSFYHKWKDARLLLINMVCTSCLTSCQTI